MTSKLEKINLLTILATFVILPVFALPITSDHVEITKSFLIVISITIAIFFAAVNFFRGNYFLRLPSKIFLGFLALTELLLFASLFKSQSVGTSLSSFNFWLLIFLPALFIIVGSLREKIMTYLEKIIVVTGILTALIGIAFSLNSVNIIGSPTQASVFFAIIIIFCVNGSKSRGSNPITQDAATISAEVGPPRRSDLLKNIVCLILVGLSLLIISKMPQPLVLDFKTSSEIFFSTLRDFPLFGIGPDLYETAFHLYKPLSFNHGEYAFLSFTQGSNFWLTTGTQYGTLLALSLLSLLSLISLSIVKKAFIAFIGSDPFRVRPSNSRPTNLSAQAGLPVTVPIRLSFLLLFASSFFLNLGPTLLYLLFFFAALIDEGNTLKVNFHASPVDFQASPVDSTWIHTFRVRSAAVLIFPSIALILAYFVSVNFMADLFYGLAANRKSPSQRLVPSKGGQGPGLKKDETIFAFYTRAITLNPRNDVYRRRLAQDYLSLATVLKDQRELSTEMRTEIESLIKKSLVEAKAAVDINPLESNNYRVSGLIYTNLIGSVDGAASTAKRLLEHAISLNPYDPLLRVDLATLYAANGQEETATDIIRGAIKLKGDYISARYQLSRLLVKLKKYREAREEYRLTLNLIGNRNLDLYQKIEKEMGEVPH